MDEHKHLQSFFFLSLLLGALILSFFVFRPFLYALILAATLAVVFHSLHEKITHFFKSHDSLAALLTVFIVVVVVLIPMAFFGVKVFDESLNLYTQISAQGDNVFLSGGEFFREIQETIGVNVNLFSFDLGYYAKRFISLVLENLGQVFSGIVQILIGFFVCILAFYFFLKDGKKIREALFAYSPLADVYDKKIFDVLAATISSVVKGTIIIAILQGIVAGIGFLIFGIPNPAVWGLATVIAALIPAIGTMLVIIPATLYLVFQGNFLFAVGMFAWGALFVGMIDNILRPKIIGKHIHIHPFLIFLSVIGGLQFFGPIGFLLGPIVISLLFVLLDIYSSIVTK